MNKKGFTLIELLIVIMILGVLASLITGNFFTSLKKGRDAKRKADLEQVQRALEIYYEDKKVYPLTADLTFGEKLCETSACAGTEKVYMQKVANDPTTSKDYEYLSDGTSYKLFACLENNLQVLPYVSSGYTTSTMTSCRPCKDSAGVDDVTHCVWGISSTNISP